MKDARNFLDYEKYERGVFWVAKKVLLKRFLLSILKKVGIFSEVRIFLGIKDEPLLDFPPPPPHH